MDKELVDRMLRYGATGYAFVASQLTNTAEFIGAANDEGVRVLVRGAVFCARTLLGWSDVERVIVLVHEEWKREGP